MRVVLVNKFWYQKGGSERYTFLLKDLLAVRGNTVIPFAMEDERNWPSEWSEHFVPHVDFWEADDAIPNQTGMLEKLSRVLWSRDAAARFGALLDEAKPDVVHLQNFAHQISPSILPECTKRGIPAVWTLHDYKALCPNYRMYTKGAPCERCKGGQYRNAVRLNCMGSRGASAAVALEMMLHHAVLDVYGKHIAAVIAPSTFMAERLREWKWEGRVEVIPNFVTRADAVPPPAPPQDAGERGQVLFIGRLAEEKGVEDFIEAAARLPKVPFAIIGDGPLAEFVRQRARHIANLTWLGQLERREVTTYLSRAALLCMPSRWYENAPYSVLEAMAAGVPVVATRIGGLPELVRDGETGVLVEPKNPKALAKTIEMLYGNGSALQAYGEAARRIATEQYGPTGHYERIIGLYRALAGVGEA
ncbi:MAG: glycosyltransferase family 4 protein [bacterium]|nr:glycosyltransferase family 4 protein [bacterium]